MSETGKRKLKELIDENFSHSMTESERVEKFEWLITRPGAYTIYSVYKNNKLSRVGVMCRNDEKTASQFYLSTEYDEEVD